YKGCAPRIRLENYQLHGPVRTLPPSYPSLVGKVRRGHALAMTRSRRTLIMDPIRRNILATGAAATAIAAAPRVFAQQAGSFYERGPVRIHFEEAGSGFPLLLIAGGGLNSTISALARGPFNPIEEFKDEYRCIAADLRNANGGQSAGPLEIDRPWDSYTDDHLGLMDHLHVDKF